MRGLGLGNVYNNMSVFRLAVYEWEQGNFKECQRMLEALHEHIGRTREVKSVHHLLPEVIRSLEVVNERLADEGTKDSGIGGGSGARERAKSR